MMNYIAQLTLQLGLFYGANPTPFIVRAASPHSNESPSTVLSTRTTPFTCRGGW